MPYKDPAKQREYQRKWMAQRRAEFFEGKVCAVCGSTDRLELDHKDPAQKVHHRIWSWSQEKREAELAKCQVLCYIHHKAKSKNEKARGEANGHAKLTWEDVKEIRRRGGEGENRVALANEFGVKVRRVYAILEGSVRKYN